MKALTFRHPWAWLIATGVKDIENRRQRVNHRGRLAIHVGMQADPSTDADSRVIRAIGRWPHQQMGEAYWAAGKVIGSVDVVGCHAVAEGCCSSEWAQAEYDGRPVLWHVELANASVLDEPIPARGQLGLWSFRLEVA